VPGKKISVSGEQVYTVRLVRRNVCLSSRYVYLVSRYVVC
jgi:hypothetical protein